MIEVFAGKGGVGKTTCASASALHHASAGERTLAISTDPTPSLSHIFGVTSGGKITKIQQSLYIYEIGSEELRGLWDRKFGRDVYEVFSSFVSIDYEDFLGFTTSLLPGLAEEFMVDHIRELSRKGNYETIVWDTAPLGQTLALLKTPAILGEHLRMAPRVYSRLKRGGRTRESVMEVIQRWRELSDQDLGFLRNEVEFTVVTIPEALAVQQLEGVLAELRRYEFHVKRLVINNVVSSRDSVFLETKAREQAEYIRFIRTMFDQLSIVEVPLFPHEIRGLGRVGEFEQALFR